MSLRTKLLLILSIIVMLTAVSTSMIVYRIAGVELEQGAKKRLQETGSLVSNLVQYRFDAELRKFEYWAAMPLVVQTALDDTNPELIAGFDDYFSIVVNRESYSSIYLINLEGDCVACDDPRRRLHSHCRKVISKKPGAVAGFAGTANIGKSELSVATGRPIVPLTAPVFHKGRVAGILRSSIDMERISEELLVSSSNSGGQRTYLFDPSLPMTLPKDHVLHAPTNRPPYQPPPQAMQVAFTRATGSIFRYHDSNGEYLAASARMDNPAWVLLVAQPMDEILAPVRLLRRTTALAVTIMLGLLALSIFLLTAPVVRGIEQCRAFAADLRQGRLNRRLNIQSRDEVGQLAHDLNEMAAQLQLNHHALKKAEQKYRGIFENAVEGIFQTDQQGAILTANPALATLLGIESPEEMVGMNSTRFYTDQQQRDEFLARLQTQGKVVNFPLSLRRRDNSVRQVVINARAEQNRQGKITLIQGIMLDVTDRLKAETRARQARETEELLIRTELEMLRYQINPHFLFNALNSLRELILIDPGQGMRMVEALAGFCHTNLINPSDSLSTVADEFTQVERYLWIEQVRYGKRLQVEIMAEEQCRSIQLPSFIIQPLVENAIKYGRKFGVTTLLVRVRASCIDDCCLIEVSNSGRWFEPETESSSTRLGLENVRRRLARQYGAKAELTISEQDGQVIVRVSLPISGATNNRSENRSS